MIGFLGRVAFILMACGLLISGGLFALSASWLADRTAELSAMGETVETESGLQAVAKRAGGVRVLVIHGEQGGFDQGMVLADLIGLEDAEVIAPSRPGYLGTGLEVAGGFREQARALARLVEAMGISGGLPVLAFGTGAPVALWLAAENPEIVEVVALVSGVYRPPEIRMPRVMRFGGVQLPDGLAGLLAEVSPCFFAEAFLEETVGLTAGETEAGASLIRKDEHLRDALGKFLLSCLPGDVRLVGTKNDLAQLGGDGAIPGDERSIVCPVLIVHGELDRISPLDSMQVVKGRLPRARTLVVRGAGHWPWVSPEWKNLRGELAFFLGAGQVGGSEGDLPAD